MRTSALAEMMNLAKRSKTQLGEVVRNASEDESISAAALKTGLEGAGMTVEFTKRENGHEVKVTNNGAQVAWAYSASESDAVKQALFAALREEAAKAASKKAEAPVNN